jgi:hypothetical protein
MGWACRCQQTPRASLKQRHPAGQHSGALMPAKKLQFKSAAAAAAARCLAHYNYYDHDYYYDYYYCYGYCYCY